ncbi:MAG: hypothetical protein NVS1B11_35520 [Terriglobales bacterium]
MSEAILADPTDVGLQARHNSLFVGVALSSFAALLLELALTRLFSVILFYHFAFLAISIALLGLGTGGVFAHLARKSLSLKPFRPLVSQLCVFNALSIPAVLEIALHVPVSLDLSGSNFLRLTLLYLASAIPFFVTGVQFSIVFARESALIPSLYGSDLAGGALACLGVVPLLNLIGAPNTILFAAAIAAMAGAVWSLTGRLRKINVGLAIALGIVIAGNYSGGWIDIVYAKGKLRDKSSVEFARWNAISRIEVDRQNNARVIVIDADANTYIMSADPSAWPGSVWQKSLMSAPPAVVNVLRPHGDYAVIGPGGGVDVLRAVANGSPDVTGIEINPIIATTIMRGRYTDYSYRLYQRPDVHIHVTDGRSFIRSSKRRYDVVQMTLVDTWASTAAGAFALSENNLYTVEAFEEYFRHLKDDGIIAITRWEFQHPREALRVVSVAIEALHRLGVQNSAKNFVVVSEGELDEDGIPVAVLIKKSPFTLAEQNSVRGHLSAYPALEALYLPSEPGKNAFSDLIASNDPQGFARLYAYNVTAVDDNAPFFFFTMKIGQMLRQEPSEQGIDWKVNLGVAVLAMVLIISLGAVLAFLVVPLALGPGLTAVNPQFAHAIGFRLLYFVAIGLGYILVEITFIQRFVLFLGHPTYALTVVVFLLLLSSGAGSLVSRRWVAKASVIRQPILVIVAILFLYVGILPSLLNSLVGAPFGQKLLLSGFLLIPLGFAMGIPFPSGLRSLVAGEGANRAHNLNECGVEWAWAMNAASSVLGSVLAMVIAIQLGLNVTLACGAVAYFAGMLLSYTFQPGPERHQARLLV